MAVAFTVAVYEEVLKKLGPQLMYLLSQATDAQITEKASLMFHRRNGTERWAMNMDGNWDVYLSRLPEPREGVSWIVDKIVAHSSNAFWRYTPGERQMLEGIAPFMDTEGIGPVVKVEQSGYVTYVGQLV